jgi:hypothetical protein
MTKANVPHKLSVTSPDAAAEAREQADEYESLFGSTELELDDDSTIKIPPHPDYGMLDDDAMAAYEQLQFEADTEYEREEDIYIPEQRLKDRETGQETGVVLPPSTQRGSLKTPYRRLVDGKSVLVTPPHSVQVVKAVLGDVEYKRLREGGKSSGDVWRVWNEQALKVRERQQRDSKSVSSTVDLAAVPTTDTK